jgi:protein SCO1/2
MLTTIRSGFSSTVAIAILAGAAFNAAPAAADNARWGAGYFPAVTLTTQDGTEVRFYDDLVKGKIVAINLIYTTCKYACPLETARLTQVAKLLGDRMGRDIFFYSISIDPEHDTPAVLKAYAEKYQIGPGWLFLTGKKSEIDTISRKLGLYSEPDPSNPDGHTPMLLIGNEETGQWMRISAMDNPKFMSRTIGDWLNSWQTAKKPTRSYADVPELKLDEGEYKFRNHCAACHTIGRGGRFGPDLAGVTARRDRDWLARFIVDPEALRAANDPVALGLRAKYQQVVMPSLDLGARDAAVLVDYIERQSAEIKRSQEIGRSGDQEQVSSQADLPRRPASGATLKPMVDAYLWIQRALNADSLVGVADDARAIAAEAAKLGAGGAAILSPAGELARASALAAARAAFGGVGDAIMRYARESGAKFEEDVKVAHCPMANRRWLQKGDVVQNPFYGKAMSDCGRIEADVASEHK